MYLANYYWILSVIGIAVVIISVTFTIMTELNYYNEIILENKLIELDQKNIYLQNQLEDRLILYENYTRYVTEQASGGNWTIYPSTGSSDEHYRKILDEITLLKTEVGTIKDAQNQMLSQTTYSNLPLGHYAVPNSHDYTGAIIGAAGIIGGAIISGMFGYIAMKKSEK